MHTKEDNITELSASQNDCMNRLVSRFHRNCAALEKTLNDVGKIYPQANLYLANDTLNLMKANPQKGRGDSHPEHIIDSHMIHGMDGGDW